jgi:hypothetical protein
MLPGSRRLDQWATVALPAEAANVGFEFEREGQRWQVNRVGLAGEMDFDHAIAKAIALDCTPLYEPEVNDSLVLEPSPAT